MRRAAVAERNRVVDVAVGRRAVTTGPATGQIPAAHERRQRRRRHITRFRRSIAGMNQRHQPRRGGQLFDHLRGNQPVGLDQPSRLGPVALDRGLLGDHVNDHRRGSRTSSRGTVGTTAPASQPVRSCGQRAQRIGTAFLTAARIMLAYGGRQRIQGFAQRARVHGEQAAVDLGDPALLIAERDLALRLAFFATAHRIGIGFGHDLVDPAGQARRRQRRPAGHLDRQLGIHRRKHLTISDQFGAVHDGAEQPKVDITGLEHLGHLRQLLAHRPGVMQPRTRQRLADPQRRRDLSGDRRRGINRPLLGLTAPAQPQRKQLPDRHQIRRRRPVLRPRRGTDAIH